MVSLNFVLNFIVSKLSVSAPRWFRVGNNYGSPTKVFPFPIKTHLHTAISQCDHGAIANTRILQMKHIDLKLHSECLAEVSKKYLRTSLMVR